MISAEDFLNILEEKDLVPSETLQRLRKRAAKSQKTIPATAIAKRLIEKGYLTRPLAKRLLATQAADKPVEAKPIADEPVAGDVVAGDVVGAVEMTQDVMAGSAFDASATADGGTLSSKRKQGKGFFGRLLPARSRRRKANVWDSSLLLLGGGGLAILAILAVVFIWVFWGNTGDAMFETANSSYEEGAYQTAVTKYDEFLKKFPDHQQASPARVRRGLATIRNATEGTRDYAKSLEITVEVLGTISTEDRFGEARDELRSLLPDIAEGLSKQAHGKTSAEYVGKTREALALVEKYVSKSHRPVTRLDDINSLLAVTEMRIARGGELIKATAAMQEAIDAGKTPRAYTIRRVLLKQYPDLLGNAELRKAVLAVAAAEKTAVRVVAEEKKAKTNGASADGASADGEPADKAPAVSISQRSFNKKVPNVNGDVVFAAIEGAAYALDATEGTVLWRREVEFGGSSQLPAFPPMRVSKRSGSDALLADASEQNGQSLVRVDAATGKLRWRQNIGGRFDAAPVIDGSRVLVATLSGRLVTIDIESGDSPGYIQLPQKLTVPPVVDSKRSRIYQAAEHSNLYVLSSVDGKCESVLYLGHEPGDITAAPVIIADYLVLAENTGLNRVTLRVLSLEPKDKKPAPFLLQKVVLEGHVDTAPVVSGPRMLVATDQGRVYALRISLTNAARPLEKVGQLQTSATENLVRYPLLVGDQFWVADDLLAKYEIQASLGTLKTKWSTCKDSVFLQPLTAGGNCIFSARHRKGLPGIIVSAIGMDRHDMFWETHLAVGPATEPVVDPAGKKATIITSLGSVFEVDVTKLKETGVSGAGVSVIDKPLVALKKIQHPADGVVRMPDGLLVLSTGRGSEQVEVFDPTATPKKFRPLVLPDALAARPIGFGDGLLMPCMTGQVFVLDPRSGGKLLEPFQPKMGTGSRPDWQPPVDAGDGKSILLSDGRRMIYRLGASPQPKEHLAALDKVELDARMASGLAVAGKTMAFVVDEKNNLRPLALPKLAPGPPQPIGGKCVWGPCGVGGKLFLANDDDKLLCFGADGKPLWTIGLIHGLPAGRPLAVGSDLIFASLDGVVWRAEASTGRELAKLETGHPLGIGPVLLGGRLLLCGHDGTLYLVDQPK